MTLNKDQLAAGAATTGAAPANLRASNLLALALASYREGQIDTAFDLFITGMEANLRQGEIASSADTFGKLIEEAMAEAASLTEGMHVTLDPAATASDIELDDPDAFAVLTASELIPDAEGDDGAGADDHAPVRGAALAANLEQL